MFFETFSGRKYLLLGAFSCQTAACNRIFKIQLSRMAGAKEHDFSFREVKGDLFSCDKDASLAHCVSADLRMGKGIATTFKTRFGGVNELRSQKQAPGGIAVLKHDERFVYYLVTKPKYFHKPTYDTLQSSLKAMKEHCQKHDVRKLAMPMIGCGLDRLEWTKVKEMIKEIFQDSNIQVTIYRL